MWRWLKVLLVITLLAAGVAPAWSQAGLPQPAPPGVAPAWTVVPSSPRVLYAPNIPGDLFLRHKKYYYYAGGFWYRGKHLTGPWRPVRKLPKDIYRIDRSFFKTPPPW